MAGGHEVANATGLYRTVNVPPGNEAVGVFLPLHFGVGYQVQILPHHLARSPVKRDFARSLLTAKIWREIKAVPTLLARVGPVPRPYPLVLQATRV